MVAWACRSCGSRPGFADLGLGLPSLFLITSGVRYIITSFSFPLFSSKSCEFGFVCDVSVNLAVFVMCLEVWLLSGGLVCDVSVRGLVVYGGLVAIWRFGL